MKKGFAVECGFSVTEQHIIEASRLAADILKSMPFSLFRVINFKTTSAMVGAIYCVELAKLVGGIINPIEKGHPDIIPASGSGASEKELRNYPEGLEIKNTIGNVKAPSRIPPGTPRIDLLSGITWQAHHTEVESMMGIVWDFAGEKLTTTGERYPIITGIFYADHLSTSDWGAISGTTGRNTKVTGMTASGKIKMGSGWILLLDDQRYLIKYQNLLGFKI